VLGEFVAGQFVADSSSQLCKSITLFVITGWIKNSSNYDSEQEREGEKDEHVDAHMTKVFDLVF
jgi:hypothetical protein